MCPVPPKVPVGGEERHVQTTKFDAKERTMAGDDDDEAAERTAGGARDETRMSLSGATTVSSSGTSVLSSGSEVSAFDDCLIEFLGTAIEAVAREGDQRSPRHTNEKDVFVGTQKIPRIGIRSYLKRLLKYMDGPTGGSQSWQQLSLGARSLIFSLIYIDRIASKTNLIVNSYRIHRLLATGILLALKMNEDDALDMRFFALLAGIPIDQLGAMETAFLSKINFDTFVGPTEFTERIKLFERLERLRHQRRGSKVRQF